MPIDITQIPTIIGNFLGVDPLVCGTIISVIITIAVLYGLALLDLKTIGIIIAGVGLLTVFTLLSWFPFWVMLPIGFIAAIVVAGEIKKMKGG